MIFCTRVIEFDAGHRLINHEGKCKYLHGHRYRLEITFTTDELDGVGRVVDFGVIKSVFSAWIDKNLDHTTILCTQDEKLGSYIEQATNQKIYYMQDNPTAENIARHILYDIAPNLLLEANIKARVTSIKLHETPNCSVFVKCE